MSNISQSASSFFSAPVLLLEYWKPIEGFEGIYEVSNTGAVCRVKPCRGTAKPYMRLKLHMGTNGYPVTTLSKNDKRRHYSTHKIVANAFLGRCPDKMNVNHINAWKLKNWTSNLEYVTHMENIHHALHIGVTPKGEKAYQAVLKEADVRQIKKLLGVITQKEIAERYDVTRECISRIAQGRNWKHIID